MHSWTLVCAALLAISASGLVKAAPSAPILINYYDEKSETRARPIRTPLRIVAEPVKSKGSITYYNNEISQDTNNIPQGVPQRLTPVTPSRQYLSQKVTRIQPVYNTGVTGPESDPVKLSLSASPLRLIPLLPVASQKYNNDVQTPKKYFGASNYVDEYVEPISIKVADNEPTTGHVAPSDHYKYETSFGDNKRPKKAKVPFKKATAISKSAYKIDGLGDSKLTIDKLAKLDKYRLKSEESSSEESNSDSDSSSSSSSEEDGSSSSEEDSSEEDGSAKENSDEEQVNQQLNYPINYYSQVRKNEQVKHQPAPINDLRVQEKISTKKSNIVYSEQGYNDKSYDHGRFTKLYEVHQRYRRDAAKPNTASEDNDEYEANIEILPIPLALDKVKSTSHLNGDELLTYIQDLIKNSSKYLPDALNQDDDDNTFSSLLLNPAEIKKLFALPNATDSHPEATESRSPTKKYPFLNHTPATALRYAENVHNFPTSADSYYGSKNLLPCDEVEPNLQTFDESQHLQNRNKNRKRLKKLGKKIECLKRRHFDENPLDNPLFGEENIPSNVINISFVGNKGQINSKLLRSLDHALNPSVNVYDDVISNIRSAIVAEHAHVKDRNQREILKLKPKAVDTESSESSHINQTVESDSLADLTAKTVVKDGIFDISKYIPRTYYDPKEEIMYAVHLTKKKKRSKSSVAKNRKFRQKAKTNDYTVFPPLENETTKSSFFKDSQYGTTNKRSQKTVHRYMPHHRTQHHPIPSLSTPVAHKSLSSGYYPYPILAVRKKRFHYELLRKAH